MASNTTGTPDYGDAEARSRQVPAQPRQETMGESVRDAQVVALRDRVRWGSVWAGLLTTFTSFLLLDLLALGLGLIATTGSIASGASTWIIAIIGLIAFFLGGYVAEWTSAVRGSDAGTLNGYMVWALGTTLILGFSVAGLGVLFGALGTAVHQLVATGGVITSVNIVAWGAFISLLLSAIAAIAGGMLAGAGRVPERAPGRVPATR